MPCRECGRAFRTRSRRVRYCSEPCRKKGYGRSYHHSPWLAAHDGTSECRECGRTFKALSRAYHYCSDECRKNGHYRRDYSVPKPPAPPKRTKCRACGRAFRTTMGPGHRRSYCSAACQAEGRRMHSRRSRRRYHADPEKHAIHLARSHASRSLRRAEAAKRRIEQCRACGRDYTPDHPNSKYCSDECRKASRARRSAAYYRRRRERRGPRKARCLACSAEFAPGLVEGGLRHYCSFACRSDARRAWGREYARQKRRLAASEAAGKSGEGGSRRRRRRQ